MGKGSSDLCMPLLPPGSRGSTHKVGPRNWYLRSDGSEGFFGGKRCGPPATLCFGLQCDCRGSIYSADKPNPIDGDSCVFSEA